MEQGEFVQILNTGCGHQNTVSTIRMEYAVVQVSNSSYRQAPTMVKAQITTLLTTEKPAIKLNFIDVEMQSGENDYGLPSSALATALVFGQQPGPFLFNQQMSADLIKAIQNKLLVSHSSISENRGSRKHFIFIFINQLNIGYSFLHGTNVNNEHVGG